MDQFKDSFKYKFGIENGNIDLLDNPYIAIKVYEYSWNNSQTKLTQSSDIKLVRCGKDWYNHYDKDKETQKPFHLFKKDVCFEDLSKLHLKGEWHE